MCMREKETKPSYISTLFSTFLPFFSSYGADALNTKIFPFMLFLESLFSNNAGVFFQVTYQSAVLVQVTISIVQN